MASALLKDGCNHVIIPNALLVISNLLKFALCVVTITMPDKIPVCAQMLDVQHAMIVMGIFVKNVCQDMVRILQGLASNALNPCVLNVMEMTPQTLAPLVNLDMN